jgi:hypothetical protein
MQVVAVEIRSFIRIRFDGPPGIRVDREGSILCDEPRRIVERVDNLQVVGERKSEKIEQGFFIPLTVNLERVDVISILSSSSIP